MDAAVRLEAHAIIDRLVTDGPTFSRDDARRLIDLIPVTRSRRMSYKGLVKSRGSGFRGHAVGVGDVNLQEETRAKRLMLNIPTSQHPNIP